MAETKVIDFSPYQPEAADPLPTAGNLILIDNYDSFTWNVYQYLILEGATVTVYRNDQITLQELIEKKPTQLVISPGPGHPDHDSGISKEAILHFSGKIPVMGVCMGEQCMYSAFGGKVDVTGEILHGKTSQLTHDGKGVYANVPQNIPVTRYHSLAGTHPSLPSCLEVTAWTTLPDGGKHIIMGIRHKEYVVEGVQFHPESILTAEGRTMLKNFLKMQGGTWAENEAYLKGATPNVAAPANGAATDKTKSILEKIYNRRKELVAAQKLVPALSPENLQAAYELGLAPPLIPFRERLRRTPFQLSLMAEIKRASPSKGIIAAAACAPAQAWQYAQSGASVISVLTEPDWFKGTIDDLRAVRQAVDGMVDRPAILRKEFIFDEYQILEARLAGADTVLLIVKMLDTETLTRLYRYSQSLGMEPLVEVQNVEEMQIAVDLGSQVIGVNNRNLADFSVDLNTTSRLMSMVPKETIVCALSGIAGPQDVEPYQKSGVGAVLVGEALMRAADLPKFVTTLLGGQGVGKTEKSAPLVKICGTRTAEAAKAAIDAGADLIGMILVTGRGRCVSQEAALEISKVVHSTPKPDVATEPTSLEGTSDFFKLTSAHHIFSPKRALLVGVFQNQPLEYILQQKKALQLDIVQLHGSEPVEWARLIPGPVIRSFKPANVEAASRGYHSIPLFDSAAGGSGKALDLSSVIERLQADPSLKVLLAGGLNPWSVQDVLEKLSAVRDQVVGVDVSSGVEDDGVQSIEKIHAFVKAAKSS